MSVVHVGFGANAGHLSDGGYAYPPVRQVPKQQWCISKRHRRLPVLSTHTLRSDTVSTCHAYNPQNLTWPSKKRDLEHFSETQGGHDESIGVIGVIVKHVELTGRLVNVVSAGIRA